jgi:hypothetical protein
MHAGVGAPQALGGEHQRRPGEVGVEFFDHLEAQRPALVGLLVEEIQRGDLVLVLLM